MIPGLCILIKKVKKWYFVKDISVLLQSNEPELQKVKNFIMNATELLLQFNQSLEI